LRTGERVLVDLDFLSEDLDLRTTECDLDLRIAEREREIRRFERERDFTLERFARLERDCVLERRYDFRLERDLLLEGFRLIGLLDLRRIRGGLLRRYRLL